VPTHVYYAKASIDSNATELDECSSVVGLNTAGVCMMCYLFLLTYLLSYYPFLWH